MQCQYSVNAVSLLFDLQCTLQRHSTFSYLSLLYLQCLCSAFAVPMQCGRIMQINTAKCLCSAFSAVSLQCLCSVPAVPVQCTCSVCAVDLQCLCSVPLQCTCSVLVVPPKCLWGNTLVGIQFLNMTIIC